ncbi:MAG TPA: hypothetical protein VFU23_10735 [Gemmatimonadales bacterium]|nr:hypothetical protein [Gemmatimonadales bacterium]
MPIDFEKASKELFTDNYKEWENGNGPSRRSNSPNGCSEILQSTANTLRRQWMPGVNTNSWSKDKKWESPKTGIQRWVSGSLSGDTGVVDFHALATGATFLWHFKIVKQ